MLASHGNLYRYVIDQKDTDTRTPPLLQWSTLCGFTISKNASTAESKFDNYSIYMRLKFDISVITCCSSNGGRLYLSIRRIVPRLIHGVGQEILRVRPGCLGIKRGECPFPSDDEWFNLRLRIASASMNRYIYLAPP